MMHAGQESCAQRPIPASRSHPVDSHTGVILAARIGLLSPNYSPERESHRDARTGVVEARATLNGKASGLARTEIRSPVYGPVLLDAGILLIAFLFSAPSA